MPHNSYPVDFSVDEINEALGRQKYPPTDEQADIIQAKLEPQLVVAGAGAGKTETMAARAVFLVANGWVSTDQILGLTFTRKAAGELNARIRHRLNQLADSGLIPSNDPRRKTIRNSQQTVLTYDSFMQKIIHEFGLLLPIEPAAQVADQPEKWLTASRVISDLGYKDESGSYTFSKKDSTARECMLDLSEAMDNHLATPEEVREESQALYDNLMNAEDNLNKKGKLIDDVAKICAAQRDRLMLLKYQEEFYKRLSDKNLMTYGQITAKATQLVREHPEIGQELRTRYRAVFLDEYQDTNSAQHEFLSALFGCTSESEDDGPIGVTAVGDPRQSIYGFRGASPANIHRFLDDFPRRKDGGLTSCKKRELSESFRNPDEVLGLANAVAKDALPGEKELKSGVKDLSGRVSLKWALDRQEEVEWVADIFAEEYRSTTSTKPFTGAILVRNNAHVAPFAEALIKRGIPVGVSPDALYDIPEVREVLSVLRVVVDPSDDEATLQVLSSPRWRIGTRDIKKLSDRAKDLARGSDDQSGARKPKHKEVDSIDIFEEKANELELPGDGTEVSLADAIADLGIRSDQVEKPAFSDEGRRRLQALSAELRWLRQQSMTVPLPDLLAQIESALGVRTEVLARQDPSEDGAAGTVHLDRLRDVAEDFTRRGGSTQEFLDYLEAADKASGTTMEAGEVAVHSDQVQILTVHSAKGLEWDVVAVPFCDNNNYLDLRTKGNKYTWTGTWLEKSELAPSPRGEADRLPADNPLDYPTFDATELETWTEIRTAANEFKEETRSVDIRSSDFLFYVAITRSARRLLVSGHNKNSSKKNSNRKRKEDPDKRSHRFCQVQNMVADELDIDVDARFQELREADADEPARITANSGGEDPTWSIDLVDPLFETPADDTEQEGPMWPSDPLGDRRESVDKAAELVRAAMEELKAESADPDKGYTPKADSGTLASTWENETTALIEEARAAHTDHIDVDLGLELTPSEVMLLSADREAFARRRARPVPFKPNPYAKRGTAFHEWLETELGGSSALIGDDDLLDDMDDGDDGVPTTQPELDSLKDAFMKSEWAGKTAGEVESGFIQNLGGYYIRGRMDAVFKSEKNGTPEWFIVDWKTGKKPTGENMKRAEIQLAMYKEALRRQLVAKGIRDPKIRAAFHYVRTNETYEPADLPSPDELAHGVLSTLDSSEIEQPGDSMQ
ncbi:UvrD-helicase domain-containing protein [Corynebacterium pseudokroppenstedtii]|uniref:UvrD-helicase domain-containing protein n=1 Tax=Corynebacterium pseudokroppenstedtii TaxID=2804917 RepID=UPI00254DA7D8|nr:UvrD-helicase domain-containing protein [Corynebacterium pseudokroppenstedtii]MDK7147133.1 UvrD-helicase domain-containing protein [Corynebacterium pseudokroppenstedtii]